MKIIVSFAGLESSQIDKPYALHRIAGSTILGHALINLIDLPFSELILLLSSGEEPVRQWVKETAPEFEFQIIIAEDTESPLDALGACRDLLDSEPVLFVAGNYISEANYHDLISSKSSASCLIQPEFDTVLAEELVMDENDNIVVGGKYKAYWAGVFWLQQGKFLKNALDATSGEIQSGLKSFLLAMTAEGFSVSTCKADYCLDTRTNDNMLHANARLLRLDHGTQDAIERSYAEDFTVLPPVFLHETAVIENSVIGPYVNLEANASISSSVVRNSLIGARTQITDAVLENSLIGENVIIIGQNSTLIVADDTTVKIQSNQ